MLIMDPQNFMMSKQYSISIDCEDNKKQVVEIHPTC